jgi:hypothetical protein
MDVAESIKAAWEAVEKSGVPEHMQQLAFREALRALLGTSAPPAKKAAHTPAPPPSGTDDKTDGTDDPTSTVNEADVYAAVAAETDVPVEKLEQVFHIDGGAVKLLGASTKYGSANAEKARNIALIVTVVRKFGMHQADTAFEVIKTACESKHAYDVGNFASKHMPSVPGCVIKGDNKKRLEAKTGATAAFVTVVDKVLGES